MLIRKLKNQHTLTKEPNKQGMPQITKNFLSEIHDLGHNLRPE